MKTLQAIDAEIDKMEKNRNLRVDFEKLARPLIEWLNENYNPYSSIIITTTDAEVVTGEMLFQTMDYIKD